MSGECGAVSLISQRRGGRAPGLPSWATGRRGRLGAAWACHYGAQRARTGRWMANQRPDPCACGRRRGYAPGRTIPRTS
eukprot:1257934-Rhodomonas_salina.8